MFQAAWPKISQRGGVEDESERKELVVEEERSGAARKLGVLYEKGFAADRVGESELRRDRKTKKEMRQYS